MAIEDSLDEVRKGASFAMRLGARRLGETWVDPDQAPELTDQWFEQADAYQGGKLVRKGKRPFISHHHGVHGDE